MSLQEATHRDDFRVAIICALPLEATMVKRILKFKYKDRGKDFGKAKVSNPSNYNGLPKMKRIMSILNI